MSEEQQKPQREPRKKPKLTLLQIMFLVAAAGIILTIAHQHGAWW